MAKKTARTKARRSNGALTFGQLKVGDVFTFVEKREGTRGRKPIFTKHAVRGYTSRLGDRLSTRAMNAQVRKVAR